MNETEFEQKLIGVLSKYHNNPSYVIDEIIGEFRQLRKEEKAKQLPPCDCGKYTRN
jgi:hypothetical protein